MDSRTDVSPSCPGQGVQGNLKEAAVRCKHQTWQSAAIGRWRRHFLPLLRFPEAPNRQTVGKDLSVQGVAGTGVGGGAGVQGQRGREHRPDQSTKVKGQRVRSGGHTAARPRHPAGLRGQGRSGQGSWAPGATRRPRPQAQPALMAAAAGAAWPRRLSEAEGPRPRPAPRKAEVGPSARGERPAVRRRQGRWGPGEQEGRDVTIPRLRLRAQDKQV